ncbi:hypothetical protein JOB18_011426 [Solea senegalensis]|uniref:Uncharacterized protein n=1 Tax=Solea senegalensis TaxID=28829 RepID=A0AAV6Q5C7_SOLSE|nr:hypothetical protein JOB18_011426 [Solea senegalensis]
MSLLTKATELNFLNLQSNLKRSLRYERSLSQDPESEPQPWGLCSEGEKKSFTSKQKVPIPCFNSLSL